MIIVRALLLLLLQQSSPAGHSAGGTTSKLAGITAPIQAARVEDTTFRHSIHKNLPCLDCHGTTSSHGEIKIVAPNGCLGCHHSAAQQMQCVTCHQRQTLTAYLKSVTFAISARRDPVVRPLLFAHARHSSLECTTCHGTDVK